MLYCSHIYIPEYAILYCSHIYTRTPEYAVLFTHIYSWIYYTVLFTHIYTWTCCTVHTLHQSMLYCSYICTLENVIYCCMNAYWIFIYSFRNVLRALMTTFRAIIPRVTTVPAFWATVNKETVSRDCQPFFWSKNSTWAPNVQAKTGSRSFSFSWRYSWKTFVRLVVH